MPDLSGTRIHIGLAPAGALVRFRSDEVRMSESKITSVDSPIRVDWTSVDVGPGRGRIGATFAPGKKGRAILSGKFDWDRDLAADLDALRRDHACDLLVSLIEDFELATLQIPDLVEEAERRGIAVLRLPIPDGHPPTMEQAHRATDLALRMARAGRSVVFHCRGGLGRAGTLAACCRVSLGDTAPVAMRETRAARRGAIENAVQEAFVAAWAAR